jgi:hypothetical protein
MKGGAITGNTAQGNNGCGGGLRISGAVFTMEGGAIFGNTVQAGRAGGVDMWNATFTMKGGVISDNIVQAGKGGGIHIGRSTFTMESGEITGNSATRNSALNLDEGTAKWGTGGIYTKGGVPQTGGSNIGNTNETLIAIPAK